MPDLSDGVNWSEVDANNNNAAPNGWPEGMMPSGVNDAARADRGALKRFWDKINPVQTLASSGGVWTFNTANPAYPTAYVSGEVYCFRPSGTSAGGDRFQVNGLAPKPIWKRAMDGTGWTPVIARDISGGVAAQLIYDATLDSGAGVFVLLNPFLPIIGDGAGGVGVPGGFAVNGGDLMLGRVDQPYASILRPGTAGFNSLAFSAAGGAPLDDVNVVANTMHVAGQLSATGYTSRSGSAGPYQTNAFNVQWTGAGGAHLWIDSADQGQIVTTSPAGDIVVGGSISAGSITASGNIGAGSITASGTLSVSGAADFAGHMTGHAGLSLNGGAGLAINDGGGLDVAGTGGFGGGLTVNGSLGGAVAIRATGGALQSDIGGTALYLPNGNVVCQAITAAGNRIILQGNNAPSLAIINTGDGSIKGIWNASNQLQFGSAGGDGAPQTTFAWFHPFGDFHVNNSLFVSGNVTIGGTLNGLPGPWMQQLDALTARVRALEEAKT